MDYFAGRSPVKRVQSLYQVRCSRGLMEAFAGRPVLPARDPSAAILLAVVRRSRCWITGERKQAVD